MKKTLTFFLFFILISGFLIFILPTETVKATTYGYSTGFEDGTLTHNYTNSWLTTTEKNKFHQVSSYHNTGSRGFITGYEDGVFTGIVGYFNLTYVGYMKDFSFELKPFQGTMATEKIEMLFYSSADSLTNPVIEIRFGGATTYSGYLAYRDISGAYHDLEQMNAVNYLNFGFSFVANDSIDYHFGSTTINGGEPRNVFDSPKIDTIKVVSTSVSYFYLLLDDFGLNVSANFVQNNTISGGCVDFSAYDNINHFFNGDYSLDITQKYIEFCSYSPVSGNLKGFELAVKGFSSPNFISELTDVGLFIGGVYCGSPVCTYRINAGFMLQWDLTAYNISLNNERVYFELFNDNPAGNLYHWTLLCKTNQINPSIDGQIWGSTTSDYINNFLDGETLKTSVNYPQWNLYFVSSSGNQSNPNYQNTIGIIDYTGTNLPNHPTYNKPFSYIYRTIFFDVYVDDVDIYTLNVYRNGVQVGFTQYYPKELNTYHKQYGFTPYDNGNYTVSMYDNNGYYLNRSFYIQDIDVDFALWTYPNPSNRYGSIGIGVYAKNPLRYTNYAIGIDYNPAQMNSLGTTIDQRIEITSFSDNYYYTETSFNTIKSLGIFSQIYLRLYGTNATVYLPITPLYTHLYESDYGESSIDTSLEDGKGETGVSFYINTKYSGSVGNAHVYLGDNDIAIVPSGDYATIYTIYKDGTYTLYLKENYNNSWRTIDSITISMGKKGTTASSDYGIFTPIIALIIIMGFVLFPVIVFRNNQFFINNGTIVVSVMGIIGLGFCIGLGLIELWFAFLIGLVCVGILVLKLYQLSMEKED